MQLTLILALVGAMLFGLNAWQFKRNGALSEKMDAVEQELANAFADAEKLAEADRKHRLEIDGLRGKARSATVAVAGLQGDCWDSDAGDSAVSALRLLNAKPEGKADNAPAGKRPHSP